jgi:hypothetical protein
VTRLLVLVLVLVSCSPRRPPDTAASDDAYPCLLHPASELGPDVVIEQHVQANKDGRTGGFDAVLQKRGGELVLVGLGPLGVRAFAIRQEGGEVRYEQRLGPEFPFPPRNVLVDVHRAFFKRLALATLSPREGIFSGPLDGEEVIESWRAAELAERRFVRQGRDGAVRVLYGPGCGEDRCEPATVRLVNEWFGYELLIENRRFQWL